MSAPHAENVLCRCLQVLESQVVDCIAVTGAETVQEVARLTGAGTGCTACHCQIRSLLACRTRCTAAHAARAAGH